MVANRPNQTNSFCPLGEGFRQYLLNGGCPGCNLDADNNGYDRQELQTAFYQYVYDKASCEKFKDSETMKLMAPIYSLPIQEFSKMADLAWFDGDGVGKDTRVSMKDLKEPTFSALFDETSVLKQAKHDCEMLCPRA